MTRIIAHRGARSIAPENTLAAAEKGRKLGAALWETDITLTGDHQLILFHDTTLTRTTDVTKVFPRRKSYRVVDYTLEEIRRLNPGRCFMETDPFGEIARGHVDAASLTAYQKEKIPTLEEALAFTREHSWPVNLELKSLPRELKDYPLVEKTIETITRMAVPRELIIISSFFHPWLRQIELAAPDIAVQALVGEDLQDGLDFGDFHFKTYNVYHRLLTTTHLARLQERNKKVNLFTVNDKKEMQRFIAMGVQGIITDYPQRMERDAAGTEF